MNPSSVLAALLLTALTGLALLTARRRLRHDKSSVPSPSGLDRLDDWIVRHRYELAVGMVLIALLGYVWAITPRDVIPFDPRTPLQRPPLAALGRVWFFFTRRASDWLVVWPAVAGLALGGLVLAGWRTGRRRPALWAAALLATVVLGIEGQIALLAQRQALALLCYGLALVGFGAWLAVRWPEPPQDPPPSRRMGRVEGLLLIAVLALTIVARFHALDRIPYGIEGDESKWTIEVVSVMLDRQHVIQSEYHYATQPVSFYMQAPFHHLLGPGILSGRIAVATYSVLGSLAFYWLVRQTLGAPAALLSTALLAVSLVDVSTSRMALVEGHVKLWAVTGLAFLSHGLRVRRPAHTLIGGIALAIGLLTYDTFAPIVGVALVWAVLVLATRRIPLREGVTQLTVLLVPILVVIPFVAEYLMGRMSYYDPGRFEWHVAPLRTFASNLLLVLRNLDRQVYGDFVFVRRGPIVSDLLVPFLALGLMLALARVRRPGHALPVLWFGLFFFPVPIYAGSPYVRVFYPGFPAIYILVTLMAQLVWREVRAALPADFRPALVAMAGLALVGILTLNLYLYFNDLVDPQDRVMRRELADTVTQAVAPGRRVYVPYVEESGDPVQYEDELFILEARRALGSSDPARHVWSGPYATFLSTLSQEAIYFDSLAFVINHSFPEHVPFLETLQHCFGARRETTGRWFDLYVADAPDVDAARCAVPRVRLTARTGSALGSGEPFYLDWFVADASGPATAHLECERLLPRTIAFQAEDMVVEGHGWHVDRRFATGFQGRAYLADEMALGSAVITVTASAADTYTAWVRLYRRTPDPYPLYLSVNEHVGELIHQPGDALSTWTWARIGEFQLGVGTHTIRLARPIQDPAPGTLALFVDALILTAHPAFDPAQDSEWHHGFEIEQDVLPYVSSGSFWHAGLPPGTYRCGLTLVDGARLFDTDGQVGARSNRLQLVVGR